MAAERRGSVRSTGKGVYGWHEGRQGAPQGQAHGLGGRAGSCLQRPHAHKSQPSPDRIAYALFLFHFLETDFSRTGQAQRCTLWAWEKREAVCLRLDRSRAAAVVNECDVLVGT